MKNLKVRTKLFALALSGSLALSGCALGNSDSFAEEVTPIFEEIIENDVKADANNADSDVTKETIYIDTIYVLEKDAETGESELKKMSLDEYSEYAKEEAMKINEFPFVIDKSTFVVATTNVNIRKYANAESDKVGILPEGSKLLYLGEEDNFYKVDYEGDEVFISKDYSYLKTERKLDNEIQQILCCTEPTTMIDYYTGEERIIPKNELIKIYDNDGVEFFGEADGYIGSIDISKAEKLEGVFVVVDKSDQMLYVYKDNKVVYTAPVITGLPTPNRDTSEGLFTVFEESFNRDLVGPTWRSYVNVMMKFHGGQGLHDAEYHTDDNGKKHGWRNPDEWTVDRYTWDGSHGCVNMRHDDALYISDNYVEIGTKVLIKK